MFNCGGQSMYRVTRPQKGFLLDELMDCWKTEF